MTRPAGVEGRWPQEEAGHSETGAEEEWQTTVWELNITKRPTTRPATSPAELEPSQHQDNSSFILNFVGRSQIEMQGGVLRIFMRGKGLRGYQPSHLPRLQTTESTTHCHSYTLPLTEISLQERLQYIGIGLLRGDQRRGETIAVSEMSSPIGGMGVSGVTYPGPPPPPPPVKPDRISRKKSCGWKMQAE